MKLWVRQLMDFLAADSLVLCNPLLRQAPERYLQCNWVSA